MKPFFAIILSLLFLLQPIVYAQTDSSVITPTSSSLRISILTCGVGDELYSAFGHTGVRVRDSIKGIDEVYNYGTFNFGDPEFYKKFTLGKLKYYLDKSSFEDFMGTYIYEKRSVDEQELNISNEQKIKVVAFLENNLLPQNREYAYDFIYDNCATRVRDILPNIIGKDFQYGDILHGNQISFRNIINQYLITHHWTRLGINLLLGSRVDSMMTDKTSMFLPDFLFKGLEGANINNHLTTNANIAVLPKTQKPFVATLNTPFWAMTGVLLLLVITYFVPALSGLKKVMNFLLLFVTGLLGCFMLFMWLGTNHQACAYNFNILWAFPLNAIIAFIAFRKKNFLKMYALLAITLLIVSMLVTVIGIQQLPLMEIIPLMAALLFVYIDLYKNNVVYPAKA